VKSQYVKCFVVTEESGESYVHVIDVHTTIQVRFTSHLHEKCISGK